MGGRAKRNSDRVIKILQAIAQDLPVSQALRDNYVCCLSLSDWTASDPSQHQGSPLRPDLVKPQESSSSEAAIKVCPASHLMHLPYVPKNQGGWGLVRNPEVPPAGSEILFQLFLRVSLRVSRWSMMNQMFLSYPAGIFPSI